MTLACLPWHDVVADFSWRNGELPLRGLHAHGSPRQLEGTLDSRVGAGAQQQTHATIEMREVPIALPLRTARRN